MSYKLDLEGVQEVSRNKGDNVRVGDYIFFCEKGSENQQLETEFLHYRIISAVQRVECAGDRESYTVLRGCWITSLFYFLYLFIYCNWVVSRWQWLFYM